MPLSVPGSNSGPGLSSLLRQARQVKSDDASGKSATDQTATATARPLARTGIDSTQRGTAQITAALTVYLSKLGGVDDGAPLRAATVKAQTPSSSAASSGAARSGAADLLRTLDSYKTSSGLRLTA